MRIFRIGNTTNRDIMTCTDRAQEKNGWIPLTSEEKEEVRRRFGSDKNCFECSYGRDDDGYFCYTHRSRSKSYPSIAKLPKDKVKSVGSTG